MKMRFRAGKVREKAPDEGRLAIEGDYFSDRLLYAGSGTFSFFASALARGGASVAS